MNTSSTVIPKRLILIDDDPEFCSYASQYARKLGVSLDYYTSLLEMGYIGQFNHYDAVILDYDLGQLNGIEIAEYLSALFGNIPAILISACDPELIGQGQWPNSVHQFISKSAGFERIIKSAIKLSQDFPRPKPTVGNPEAIRLETVANH